MEATIATPAKKRTQKSAPKNAAVAVDNIYESILVPLSLLVLSDDNVGKTGRDDVAELSALIASQGLLHPLLVQEQLVDGVPSGYYEVIDGGRRWRGMNLLVKQKRLKKDQDVECKLITRGSATEISMAANLGREETHPADQFVAFKKLVDDGKSIAEIATRFGVAQLTIERRLRLANVSPVLFEEFRLGNIALDQMMALAVTDDHELQEIVWNNAAGYERQPNQLRSKLTEGDLDTARHPLVKLVGIEAYTQAGGSVRRDLFSGDGNEGFIEDAGLLRKLANDKLTAVADAVKAEGWAWVQVLESFGYSERCAYGTLRATPREATEAEQAELDSLDTQRDQLCEQLETLEESDDYDEEAVEKLQEAVEAVDERVEAIEAQQQEWNASVMTVSGAVVSVGDSGGMLVQRGLVRPEDKAQASSATGVALHSAGDKPVKVKQEYSEKLVFKLSSHRTAAMQAAMIDNHHVALVALTHALLAREFTHYPLSSVKVSGTSSLHSIRDKADDMQVSRAWTAIQAKRAELEARLPESHDMYFAWLLAQDTSELLEILAFLTAITVDVTTARADAIPSPGLSDALQIDMADWWEPTAISFLGQIPKSKVVNVVAESAGPGEVAGMLAMKKAELLAAAERKLAGRRWLPSLLRSQPADMDQE